MCYTSSQPNAFCFYLLLFLVMLNVSSLEQNETLYNIWLVFVCTTQIDHYKISLMFVVCVCVSCVSVMKIAQNSGL